MRYRPALIQRLTADVVALWKGSYIYAVNLTKIMSSSQIQETFQIPRSSNNITNELKVIMATLDSNFNAPFFKVNVSDKELLK
ncbi:hypothetical protein F4775DRAFT_592392 [Biscogniauxia sp. FL1348]|nr:hypothetical protein F4775DRAFT_592392 [Biscogniauxia sp. FL1348]